MNLSDVAELRWRYGGPRDFWLLHAPTIKQMIDANKLHPLPPEWANGPMLEAAHGAQAATAPALHAVPEATIPALHRSQFPGGIRLPHLHFEGRAYLVSAEQWRAFTERVLEDFKANLSRVKTISFDQLMSVGDAAVHLHGT